jgi:hypothetical protein
MSEPAPLHWKRLLKIMADRNRNQLGEHAYRALLDALESNTEVRALRRLAIDTAETLGRRDGNRAPPWFEDKALNRAYLDQSPRPDSPPPAMTPDIRIPSQENASRILTRHRPAPRRS